METSRAAAAAGTRIVRGRESPATRIVRGDERTYERDRPFRYNPRKKNQDALAMREDPATQTQAILVLDGHGEAGDLVSNYFANRYVEEVFAHPRWPDGRAGMRAASADVLAKLERELIEDRSVDTEFSGSTFVFAALRDGELFVANVGDSRVTLGVEKDGAVAAEAISIDHKPELPAEKKRILAAGGRVFAVECRGGVEISSSANRFPGGSRRRRGCRAVVAGRCHAGAAWWRRVAATAAAAARWRRVG